jgi:chromosome segregation ATPase
MWGNKDDKKDELKATIRGLEEERSGLKREVEDLKSKKKIEEEQIKHLVKIKDEKRELEYKGKEMDLEAKKNADVAEVKDKYRDKLEENLIAQKDDIKGMYSEILKRLPDINARLKGDL